jgi:hypothetical protein
MERTLDAAQKAFEINLDNSIYGTFAEIGAGQEVARHFFRAGGAAGTIAKSMSAYDMTVSDDIYGRSGRYVSKERVVTMLDHEYGQLIDRLGKDRGKETRFFVFADTVAAKSFKYNSECHGWMGVRFQHEPEEECSQIVIHVRMEDQVNLQQQEALGILGTNLIHNCFRLRENRVEFVRSLMDNITTDRILIDYISVSGPGFTEQDSRLWPLELVKRGFTEAILFGRDGEVLSTKDIIYKKNVLVSRASYRPPTHFNLDMLAKGQSVFCENLTKEEQESVLILPEISMSKLKERGQVISEDFLARVDLLGSLGQMCLITSFNTYGELSYYLNQYTNERVAFVMGYYNLQEVFNHEKYADKPGGLFGGIGALLGHRTQLFVYPALGEDGKSILKTKDADVTDEIKPLIDYLISIKRIKDIDDYDKDHFAIWSRVVLKMIQNKEDGWEEMVPEVVAKTVKERCLFEYPCDPS